MKIFYLVLILLYFSSCTKSQKSISGTLTIDKEIQTKFSDGPHPGTFEGSSKTYINGVLIDSTHLLEPKQKLINADIQEVKIRSIVFDTCRSFLSGDTIVIEFNQINPFHSIGTIRLKIIENNFSIFMLEKNKETFIEKGSLVLNDKTNRPKNEIMGKLTFQYFNKEKNKEFSFKGPFICTIE